MVLDTQGQLRLQKRFDYQPVAFTTYPVRQQLLSSVQSTMSMLAFVTSQPFYIAFGASQRALFDCTCELQ